MLSELKVGHRVVGLKQSQKAVCEKLAKRAYIAQDADIRLRQSFAELCTQNSVETVSVETMKLLGHACGIDVGAAVAVLLA